MPSLGPNGATGILDPLPGRQKTPPMAYVEPSALAYLVVFVSFFALNYNVPPNWFVATIDARAFEPAAPQGYVAVILGLTALVGLATMGNHLEALGTLARQEPLLPAFIFLLNVSVLWSSAPLTTLRFVLSVDLVVMIGYWIAAHFKLRSVLLIVCAAFTLGTLVNFVWVYALPQYGQSALGASGVFDNKNGFGRAAVLAAIHFTLAAGVFRRFRIFWLAMMGAAAFQVILSDSKTSLGSLVLVWCLMLVFKTFRARSTLYGAVGISLGASTLLAVLLATANLGPITKLLGKDVTLTGRTTLWRDSLDLGFRRPVLGYGWEGFWNGWFGPSHPIISTYQWRVPHAHNALIEYFLALGIVGVLLFCALYLRFLARATRTVGRESGPLGMWPLAYASFTALFSVTEAGVIGRDGAFLLFVILILAASLDRRSHSSSDSTDAPIRPLPMSGIADDL